MDASGRARIGAARERRGLGAAALELANRGGARGLAPAAVCARAGIAEERFARHFGDVEDCLLEACEAGAARLVAAVRGAFAAAGEWRGGLRAAAWAAAGAIEADPEAWRFWVLEAPGAGPRLRAAREAREAELLELLRGGREERGAKAEGVLGGILAVGAAALEGGGGRPAASYVPELLFLAVAAFEGAAAARGELAARRPAAALTA
jgi:AcrR family transcriptional regulator